MHFGLETTYGAENQRKLHSTTRRMQWRQRKCHKLYWNHVDVFATSGFCKDSWPTLWSLRHSSPLSPGHGKSGRVMTALRLPRVNIANSLEHAGKRRNRIWWNAVECGNIPRYHTIGPPSCENNYFWTSSNGSKEDDQPDMHGVTWRTDWWQWVRPKNVISNSLYAVFNK